MFQLRELYFRLQFQWHLTETKIAIPPKLDGYSADRTLNASASILICYGGRALREKVWSKKLNERRKTHPATGEQKYKI